MIISSANSGRFFFSSFNVESDWFNKLSGYGMHKATWKCGRMTKKLKRKSLGIELRYRANAWGENTICFREALCLCKAIPKNGTKRISQFADTQWTIIYSVFYKTNKSFWLNLGHSANIKIFLPFRRQEKRTDSELFSFTFLLFKYSDAVLLQLRKWCKWWPY